MKYITTAERIGMEKGREEGLKEGFAKGRQEGRQEGLLIGEILFAQEVSIWKFIAGKSLGKKQWRI